MGVVVPGKKKYIYNRVLQRVLRQTALLQFHG